MLDYIAELWTQFRYGYAEACHIAVSVGRRDIALDLQRSLIDGGLDCRIEMTDHFECGDQSIDINDKTMVVVTEYSGGIITGPNVAVYIMKFKEL